MLTLAASRVCHPLAHVLLPSFGLSRGSALISRSPFKAFMAATLVCASPLVEAHRALARPLAAASRLHAQPRFSVALRACAPASPCAPGSNASGLVVVALSALLADTMLAVPSARAGAVPTIGSARPRMLEGRIPSCPCQRSQSSLNRSHPRLHVNAQGVGFPRVLFGDHSCASPSLVHTNNKKVRLPSRPRWRSQPCSPSFVCVNTRGVDFPRVCVSDHSCTPPCLCTSTHKGSTSLASMLTITAALPPSDLQGSAWLKNPGLGLAW